MRLKLDEHTLSLLNWLESRDDENQRRVAIFELARQGGMNAARILIETFERTMWRATKFSLLQGLGLVRHERATEFLCQTAMGIDDFAMAAEAVLALGQSDSPVAGEFLANIVRTTDHPLVKEALSALGNMNVFPCHFEVEQCLNVSQQATPGSVFQNAMIAAGLRGYRKFLPVITEVLTRQSSGPLFNTAIMALGRLGDRDSLQILEGLDTRAKAFAHQLKLSAMEHIRLRLGLTIEDAVSSVLSAETPQALRHSWQILGFFPEDACKEAFQLLVPDASPSFQATVRLAFFRANDLVDDFKFLSKYSDNLSDDIFAGLVREHLSVQKRDEFLQILLAQDARFRLRVLTFVRFEKAEDLLFELIADQKSTREMKISAVNGLVAQSMMLGVKFIAIRPLMPDMRTSFGKRIVKLIEVEGDEVVKTRLVRALGQIRYLGPDASNFFREALKTSGPISVASYAALAQCNADEATRIITKRLRQIIGLAEHRGEVVSAIRGLAKCDSVADASPLSLVPVDILNDSKTAILKILCGSTVPELTDFVAHALMDDDFQNRVLAIVAAKRHHSTEIWAALERLLSHDNQCLAGRALDTLTTAGGRSQHARLLEILKEYCVDQDFCLKVFRSLVPRPGDSYVDVITELDRLINDKPGALSQQEVLTAAINLRDNLSVLHLGQAVGSSIVNKTITPRDSHVIDETLQRDLRGFARYSEVVKTVLRSGELTWQHPELFDARVDKSTVIVQYVKSIDLLLQEKIGSQIFLSQGSDTLQKMQSRVVWLELDEDTGFGPELIHSLDCSLYFSRDTFPAHKLALICRSVMSGLIMKEQYKVIDGLRAWALLLLIFGRTFRSKGQLIEPIFPIAKPQNELIARLARAMNDLQDLRNRAAHRGTILEMKNMYDMRSLCVGLLNDLDIHLRLPVVSI
jgi:hypothetical protein